MAEEGVINELWEGGSCCMSGGVRLIPRSKDGMGDSSRNDCGVGGRTSDPGQGSGVGGGMVGQGDGCGVGEGMVGVGARCGLGEEIVGVGAGCGLGEGMVAVGDGCRDGCGVDEGMVGLGDACGVDGEGSGVGTSRGVATGRRDHPVGAVLVLGPVGIAASSIGASGIGGWTRVIAYAAVSTSEMSLWSSVPTG